MSIIAPEWMTYHISVAHVSLIVRGMVKENVFTSDLNPEPFPVGAWRNSSVPLKQSAEEDDILVAHRLADLLHSTVIALQHALGSSDPQLLQVNQGAVSSRVLKAP